MVENESETPLLHEYNGIIKESGASLELLQPSCFLKEIPRHILDVQDELTRNEMSNMTKNPQEELIRVLMLH
ncbi:hypothetical protein C5167_006171 [Papaver somniferum]|uniref:Uncharacterized protein n=1 Tax=Papaver somniferum TaxID=3469 RepID=A0A4Y7JG14_PAPSO|nr:hypothetical protein C5167_006171 [Papaver somniferum]